MIDDRRYRSTDRFSSDEDRALFVSDRFSLEEAQCQRSTVRSQRAAVRFVVDEDRAGRSADPASAPTARFLGETPVDFALFT
jgi:hypothetical protein